MRTETREIFKFDELSDEAKEKAREWWRHISSGDSFDAECTIDDFCRYARILGFDVGTSEVQFSGFWSQGDGASFSGQFCLSGYGAGPISEYANDARLDAIEAAIKKSKRVFYSHLIRAIPCEFMRDVRGMFTNRLACAYVVISRGNSRYSHEMTMRHDDGANILEDLEYRLGDNAENCNMSAIEKACEEFAENILDDARSMAQHLYHSLERDYDWAQSDEYIDDILIANEYEFTEDGEEV